MALKNRLTTDQSLRPLLARYVPLNLVDAEADHKGEWLQRYRPEGNAIPFVFVVRADGEKLYAKSGAPEALPQFLAEHLKQAGTVLSDAEVTRLEQDIEAKDTQIRRLTAGGGGATGVSEEQLNELLDRKETLQEQIGELTTQNDDLSVQVQDAEEQLATVQDDIELANEQYVDAQEALEDIENQTSIVQARRDRLFAEVDRLTGQVGSLDEANLRRLATKETLAHDLDRLISQPARCRP